MEDQAGSVVLPRSCLAEQPRGVFLGDVLKYDFIVDLNVRDTIDLPDSFTEEEVREALNDWVCEKVNQKLRYKYEVEVKESI